MDGSRDIYQTVAATEPIGYSNTHQPDLLQDGVALVTIFSPVIIAIGFFFTLKSKTIELESMIKDIGSSFQKSLDSAHEILLLKIDAKLIVFNERIDTLKAEVKEGQESAKEIEYEIKKIQATEQDIINQLSKAGIDIRARRVTRRGDKDTLT